MEKYSKICGNCGNEIIYKYKRSLILSEGKNCQKCAASKTMTNRNIQAAKEIKIGIRKNSMAGKSIYSVWLKKYGKEEADRLNSIMSKRHSTSQSGIKSGMYGKSVYSIWLKKYGKEEADKKQAALSKKISSNISGKGNPMYGKPAPHGSGNGWSGWYNGKFFRSFLELSYMVNILTRFNLKWESAEHSKYKIRYKDYKNTERTYTADFIISNKYMVEIKPKKLHNTSLIQSKANAAIEFCKNNNLIYKLISPRKLSKDEIFELHSTGSIKFTKRYEEKFKVY